MENKNWYEAETLQNTPAYKAVEGEQLLTIVGEPSSIQMPDFKDKEKMRNKLVFPVEVDKKLFAWFVNEGKSKDSLCGQLIALAKQNHGLNGATLRLTRMGSGIRTAYKVVLA